MNESDYCPVTFKVVEDLARICGEAFVYFDDKRKLEKYSRDKVPEQYGHMPEIRICQELGAIEEYFKSRQSI